MTSSVQTNVSGLPRGELLGRYGSYEDAQKVVDHLAAAEDFDIKALSIVGNDLRSVEHIKTRLSYPRVALAGAAQGAMFGFFIGLLFLLISPDSAWLNLVMSVILGTAIWMILGVVSYAVRKGQRDFASSSRMVALNFDVVCDFSVSAKARSLVYSAGVPSLSVSSPGHPQNLGVRSAQAPQQGFAAQQSPSTQHTADVASAASNQGARTTGSGTDGADHRAQQNDQQAPSRVSLGYQDLPDGRPRFGARSSDQAISGEQGSTEQPKPEDQVPRDQAEPENQSSTEHSKPVEHNATEQNSSDDRSNRG